MKTLRVRPTDAHPRLDIRICALKRKLWPHALVIQVI